MLTHTIVYKEEGRFAGWPANNGIWSWGDEILVGFTVGYHKDQSGHTIDRNRSIRNKFARSLDGGITWFIEDEFEKGFTATSSEHILGDNTEVPTDCSGGIDFTHPGYAMAWRRITNDVGPSIFYYSYDRGLSWHGPFTFPDFGRVGTTNRTDYSVEGKHELLSFLTVGHGRVGCARTNDGGGTWQLVSWIGADWAALGKPYSVMPASVRLSLTKIIIAIRCFPARLSPSDPAYLSCYLSEDNAGTWRRLESPAPDLGSGNPPAMIQLNDGRLCLVYGVRPQRKGDQSRVCARLSSDDGLSWSNEIVLRGNDGANWDMGYSRIVQRPNGKVVAVYYYNHALLPQESPHRYIAATIFDPNDFDSQ